MELTAFPGPNESRIDDVQLLSDVTRGDEDAVRRLMDEVAPVVYGFLFARVGGDEPVAEDLLQETLLEAVRSAPNYRGDAALSTWLCVIARRRLARYYESERKAETARRGLRVVTEAVEETEVDNFDRQDEVVRALGRLSALHRQVLVLKYLDGCPVEEIAKQLQRSRVQIQSLLQRARDSLRREMQNHDS
jgi:RNA polymerase sigma-70 factor (ECF subfamily)